MSDVTNLSPDRPFAAIGTTGLAVSSGLVWEEYDPALRGKAAIDAYTKMARSDPTCGAILWAIESILRGVQWDCKPHMPYGSPYDADPSTAAQEGAAFLRECLFDDMETPWEQVISEALSCLTYGYALAEKVYKERDDGLIGIKDISPRPQDSIRRWVFDDNGDLLGVIQAKPNTPTGEVGIPIAKLLHFRVRTFKRNPEGVSIFRNAYKPWVYATNLANIEAIGMERDLAGLPIARIPKEVLTDAQAGDANAIMVVQQFTSIVRDLRRNEQAGVVIASDTFPTPDGSGTNNIRQYDIELLSAPSNRSSDSDVVIRRHRGDIATTVLADFLLLGQGQTSSGGSYALSADKTDMFMASLVAIKDTLAAIIQRHLVKPLWDLNGFPIETMPVLTAGPLAEADAKTMAEYISKLAAAGARMFPDTELENTLRRKAGLPPLTEETIREAQQVAEQDMQLRAQEALASRPPAAPGDAQGARRPSGGNVVRMPARRA